MSNHSIEPTKQEQQEREEEIETTPKVKETKVDKQQPTQSHSVEFDVPHLLNLSTLTPNHFRVFGKPGNQPGEFDTPMGITQQRTTGRYFVSEWKNHRIQAFDENMNHQMFIGSGPGSQQGQLKYPSGVAVSEEGRLAVCDWGNKRIQIFDVNNDFLFVSMVKLDSKPRSVTIEEGTGRLFVSLQSNQIGILTYDGQLVKSFGTRGSSQGQLSSPMGVALNSRGDLFVGDSDNKRVSVFDNTGDYLCHFGSDAKFDGGFGLELAIDSFDRIVVSDSYSHKISMFDCEFELIGQYGSYGSEIGEFDEPKRMLFDRRSNLVVCDSENNRLQIISTTTH